MSGRHAFATLVTSDGYLPGALALAAALKEVHPSPPVHPEVPFQLVCIVTPETVDVKTIKFLRKAFDTVIGVEVIEEELSEELKLLGESLFTIFTALKSHTSGWRKVSPLSVLMGCAMFDASVPERVAERTSSAISSTYHVLVIEHGVKLDTSPDCRFPPYF